MTDPEGGGLGDFLRSRRERLDPKALGLAALRARRTPGLRREEVAERAGIGIDWYVRLEQGRSASPSPGTIDALAGALCLSQDEHAHLRTLACHRERRAFRRETVPDAVRRIVHTLNQPAYVTGRRWDVLAWNDAAADILTDFARLAEEDRNILVYMLTAQSARERFGAGWAAEAQRMVAQFRATHDFWAGDPAFSALLARLRSDSPDFAGWWARHDIRATALGRKRLHHPVRGAERFDYATFQVNEDPALRLAIYTPA